MRTDFDGETRGPVVIVAIRARRNAKNGAKYHCGVTAVERLMKASIVTRSAYRREKMIRTPLMSWK
jgi:hypothetical protein